MKQFNTLREETLEEKLKASDPAGTYIHDFVHSDNPKFTGKSKAKRIQMALAASYAAKGKSRNEEVEIDEEQKTMSRAAKGYEKYGKEGMTKLSQEAQKGASEKKMDAIRDKYNKYDESVDEGMMDAVKTMAKKATKALTGGSDEDQLKNLQKKMGVPQTGKKPTSEETELDEASYSAKAARAGKDIGKPGKNFSKIAKDAGKRYGSKAAGNRVAGAILAKLRKEETELDEVNMTAHIKRQATKLRMKAGGIKMNQPTTRAPFPAPTSTSEGTVQDVADASMNLIGQSASALNKVTKGKDPSSLVGKKTK
jgi:hypothetical protein